MKRISLFCLALLLTSSSAILANPGPGAGAQKVRYRPVRVLVSPDESYMGIHLKEVTSDSVRQLNLKEERGALLTEVINSSPAAKAGLQKDDVIIRWNGERVDSVAELTRLRRETPPGRTVRLGIVRDGAEMDMVIELGNRSDRLNLTSRVRDDAIRSVFVSERGRMGISLQSLTPQLARYFGVSEGTGALITSVQDDSPAARAGLKAGDVILSVGGDSIEGSSNFLRALSRRDEGPVEVKVMRNKQEMTFTVQLEKGHSSEFFYDRDFDGLLFSPPDMVFSMPDIHFPNIEPMLIPMPEISIPHFTMPKLMLDPIVVPLPDIQIPPIQFRLLDGVKRVTL